MQNYYKQGNVAALETELRNAEKARPPERRPARHAGQHPAQEERQGRLRQHHREAGGQLSEGPVLDRPAEPRAGQAGLLGPPGGRRVPPEAGQQPDEEAERVHGNGPAGAAGEGAGAKPSRSSTRATRPARWASVPTPPRHQRLKDLAEKTLADQNKNAAADEAALTKAKRQRRPGSPSVTAWCRPARPTRA